MRRFVLPFTAALTAVSGCDLIGALNQPFDVPLDLVTPAQEVDVDAAVAAGVDEACGDPNSQGCKGIKALCAAENGGQACDPVALPASVRTAIDIDADGTDETLDSVLEDSGLGTASQPKGVVPVDMTEALTAAGVQDSSEIQDVSFQAVALAFSDNTLTFDIPVMDIYLGDTTDSTDADALVTSGAVTKIGTLGTNTDEDPALDIGISAGTDGVVPVEFVEGGNALFNEKLRSMKFTLVLRAPDGQSLALKADPADGTHVISPAGKVKISLQATVVYKVSLSDVAAAADSGT